MTDGALQPIRFDVARFLAFNGYAEALDLDGVPERYRRAMREYLRGTLPEVPLRSLLEGRLAAVRLFRDDLPGLVTLVAWLHDELPSACWGSPDQVQIWVAWARRARRDQDHGSQAQESPEARP